MKNFGKVVGKNLVILVTYSLLIRLLFTLTGSGDRQIEIAALSAIAVGVHVLTCLATSISAFRSKDKDGGANWLGTTAIVLVVGFSVCLGNVSLG